MTPARAGTTEFVSACVYGVLHDPRSRGDDIHDKAKAARADG